MREPIYGKEYVGADICEVFKEEGKGDPLYDDEYIPDDIREVFEKEGKEEPIYDEKHVPAEYDESLDVKRSLQTATTTKKKTMSSHEIFHTHCTSQDMGCTVFIDNKICKNVASKYIS